MEKPYSFNISIDTPWFNKVNSIISILGTIFPLELYNSFETFSSKSTNFTLIFPKRENNALFILFISSSLLSANSFSFTDSLFCGSSKIFDFEFKQFSLYSSSNFIVWFFLFLFFKLFSEYKMISLSASLWVLYKFSLFSFILCE